MASSRLEDSKYRPDWYVKIVTFALVQFLFPVASPAEDDPFDLFVRALEHRGNAVIWSGDVTYEVTTTTPPPSEYSIQGEIDKRISSVKRDLDSVDSATREIYEKAIERIPAAVRARQSGIRRERFHFMFDGTGKAASRLYEYSVYDPAMNRWGEPTRCLRSGAHSGKARNVLWEPVAQTAVLPKTPFTAADVQQFGRIQGVPAMLAVAHLSPAEGHRLARFDEFRISEMRKELDNQARIFGGKTFQSAGTVAYDHSLATVIEVRAPNPSRAMTAVYHIDRNRDYVCPLIQLYSSGGNLVYEYQSSNYFLDEKSGLWFPGSYEEVEYSTDTGQELKRQSFVFDPAKVSLNRTIHPTEFAIVLPAGAALIDERGDVQRKYNIPQESVFDLLNDEWDVSGWPEVEAVSARSYNDISSMSRNWVLLISINLSFVMLVLAVWVSRRSRGK